LNELIKYLLDNSFEYFIKKTKQDVYLIDYKFYLKDDICVLITVNYSKHSYKLTLYNKWSFFLNCGEVIIEDASPKEIIEYIKKEEE
jgi:hypothetical protein